MRRPSHDEFHECGLRIEKILSQADPPLWPDQIAEIGKCIIQMAFMDLGDDDCFAMKAALEAQLPGRLDEAIALTRKLRERHCVMRSETSDRLQ